MVKEVLFDLVLEAACEVEPVFNFASVCVCVSSRFLCSLKLEKKKMAQEKTKPVHEVRLGRIRAAIWENETQNGTRHNVTVSRLYKDGDQWKDSTSFGREDLPVVCKVLDMAHTWIYEHPSQSNASND